MKSKGLQGHQHHRSLLCKMLWCKYNVFDVVMSVTPCLHDSMLPHVHVHVHVHVVY